MYYYVLPSKTVWTFDTFKRKQNKTNVSVKANEAPRHVHIDIGKPVLMLEKDDCFNRLSIWYYLNFYNDYHLSCFPSIGTWHNGKEYLPMRGFKNKFC